MGGELVLQITQGAEDGCVSRVLCYRYSNRFFSAPWTDEYRGELLLHNPDYPTSSPPQSTLLYTVSRSRLDIYLWSGLVPLAKSSWTVPLVLRVRPRKRRSEIIQMGGCFHLTPFSKTLTEESGSANYRRFPHLPQ